jgi:hypothetical protein
MKDKNKENIKKMIKLIRKNKELLNDISSFKTQMTDILEEVIDMSSVTPCMSIYLNRSGDTLLYEGLMDSVLISDLYDEINEIIPMFYYIENEAPYQRLPLKDTMFEITTNYLYENNLIDWADNVEKKLSLKFDYYGESFRKLRLQVFLRDGEVCAYCNEKPKPGISLTVDHIKPVSKFPELALDIDNLQVLCWECNQKKSNKY